MARIHEDWLGAPGVRAAFDLIEGAGFKAYFVGGCVRNALLGRQAADIDICTDALPDDVLRLAQGRGIKTLEIGKSHGTVTLKLPGGPYEVTTFRRDVETDGRRASVEFGGGIEGDSLRRDFTINALYADRDGEVLDPQGGIRDLEAGRVRFIGRAEDRIREDFLRIPRLFRMHAWYGDPEAGLDREALDACSRLAGNVKLLSRERITHETLKLLGADNPAFSLEAMQKAGVLPLVVPGADVEAARRLVSAERRMGLKPDRIRRLAAAGFAGDTGVLRLKSRERKEIEILWSFAKKACGPAELGYHLGERQAASALALKSAIDGHDPPADWRGEVRRGAQAQFPVKASDLMDRLRGAELGKKLRELEEQWIRSGFKARREDLLGGS